MKILHTSDWHLGHVLYGYDRREEQTDMLRQMAKIVKKEKPDLFLLCGDVFHTSQPSAGVNKMFVSAISEIRRNNPEMTIVVIAGNHDSGTRHEVFSELWEEFNVHTLGTVHGDNPADHIIEIPDIGFVVAIPYVHPRLLPEGFIQDLLDKVAEMNSQNLPVVMTGHTTISNSKFKGHEDVTEFSVGGIEGIEIRELGEGYDYLALGHIHQRQFLDPARARVRYSGSPLAVSFDEEKTHTVSIVEIAKRGDLPVTTEIEIKNTRPLVTLPAEGTVSWDIARQLLKEYPDKEKTYLRLRVEVDDFLPAGANDEAYHLTRNKKSRFCVINTTRKNSSKEYGKAFSVQEFKEQQPIDIFRKYMEETGGIFDEEIESLFKEALNELDKD